jgi:sucrose-6-phosphate hydrolase SacC (GH32 family)
MRAIPDAASMELFADGGAVAMTEIFFPSAPFAAMKLVRRGGEPVAVDVKAQPIASAMTR